MIGLRFGTPKFVLGKWKTARVNDNFVWGMFVLKYGGKTRNSRVISGSQRPVR
ncbi:hypothetical protein HanXRQr2_Chr02g0072001 [Helianthus annuus]|uniref:Uncharacterized protein n=1 Tax=Helianthus annuus TaxID=4232 RepID=A0A9K3NZD2_HELAN|nr:hypothetical protein HanXRQr2_Chr02g0072001 [Helianthus annuus]KAJ0958929.1 hypothetical protein HanPSC8_Chr01g0044311 [Helianthus annuus]